MDANHDFGVQNPSHRTDMAPDSSPTPPRGGRMVARHLINLARLPFDFQNNAINTSDERRLDIDLDGIETRADGDRGGWPGMRLQTQVGARLSVRNWWMRPEPVDFDPVADVLGVRLPRTGSRGPFTWDDEAVTLGGRSLFGEWPVLMGEAGRGRLGRPELGGYRFDAFYVPPGLAGDIYTWQPPRPALDGPLVVAWRCVKTGSGWAGLKPPGGANLAQWVPLRALMPARA